MHAPTTDTTFWYACAFVHTDLHFCLLRHLYKVVIFEKCAFETLYSSWQAGVFASVDLQMCSVRHYWSVITCKMMREQVREILNQWTQVPSVKTSPRAVRVSKAIYRRRDEMRCGLSFRGSHLTHHSTESSSTPQQNIFVLLLCALSVYLPDRVSNLDVFFPEEAAVMKRLERWQLLSFTLCCSTAEHASRRSFRQLRWITITVNASEWTFLQRKPPLWVLTKQFIRNMSITWANNTGSPEVQQDRHFQPDWVFVSEKTEWIIYF